MWKRLFPKALPQAAHTKQVVCHVCRRACITSCNTSHGTTCQTVHLCTGVHVHRGASHPHDLGVAAGAGGGEELLVAVLTVDVVLLLHKADVSQRHVAVVTVKLLGVPGPTQSHQERAPADNNSTRSSC